MIHWFIYSSPLFLDSVMHWFLDSLIIWFYDSLIPWFLDSLISWFHDSYSWSFLTLYRILRSVTNTIGNWFSPFNLVLVQGPYRIQGHSGTLQDTGSLRELTGYRAFQGPYRMKVLWRNLQDTRPFRKLKETGPFRDLTEYRCLSGTLQDTGSFSKLTRYVVLKGP